MISRLKILSIIISWMKILPDITGLRSGLARSSAYFSLLAIFVACLGLFGLASFMTSQRTKEIGIRKVLGSSVSQLIRLLAYDSVKWVLLANVIAWPVCWIIMNNWLKKFAFRTNIDIFILLLAGLMALFIALITVIFHTYKAASANPVEALKYE